MARGGPRPNSGGKRNGAGRKKGAAALKTREIADHEAASGKLMPLSVMLAVMRRLYKDKEYVKAAGIASQAAPYCHARFSSVELSGPDGKPVPITIVEFADAEPRQSVH